MNLIYIRRRGRCCCWYCRCLCAWKFTFIRSDLKWFECVSVYLGQFASTQTKDFSDDDRPTDRRACMFSVFVFVFFFFFLHSFVVRISMWTMQAKHTSCQPNDYTITFRHIDDGKGDQADERKEKQNETRVVWWHSPAYSMCATVCV